MRKWEEMRGNPGKTAQNNQICAFKAVFACDIFSSGSSPAASYPGYNRRFYRASKIFFKGS
jgi:hypothetical protein